MKKVLLVLACFLLIPAILCAQQASITYMPLVYSQRFTDRVTYILAQEAPVIQTEAATGSYTAACHTLRANLAAAISRGPQSYANVFAVHLATNINVTSAGALTGAVGTLDTPATDAALLAAIASLWSTVSGCLTNP